MSLPPDPRSPRRRWLESLIAIVIIAIAPLIPSLIALAIATPLGCELNEGGTAPCVIAGVDFGVPLTVMALTGIFVVFTLPLGLILFSIWCIAAGVVFFRRRRSRP
jgi:hypothetical protein